MIYFYEKRSANGKEENNPLPNYVPALPGGMLLHSRRSLQRPRRWFVVVFVVVSPFQPSLL